jgi:2-oxoglutarate ferredoxin oxidoreductase subunit delta
MLEDTNGGSVGLKWLLWFRINDDAHHPHQAVNGSNLARTTDLTDRSKESKMARGTVLIDRNRCKGCELCVNACPQQVLHLSSSRNARGYHPVELSENGHHCTGCAICAVVCPDVVFTVYREAKPALRAA